MLENDELKFAMQAFPLKKEQPRTFVQRIEDDRRKS